MTNAISKLPEPYNEPVWDYAPGSTERECLQKELKKLRSLTPEIPNWIGEEQIHTSEKGTCVCPHDHQHILATFSKAGTAEIEKAIECALKAREKWAALPWENRTAIFLKVADLITGPYRAKLSAATMLGQSKNAYQSEIDAICEFADFLRFNVKYLEEIYSEQPPKNSQGLWNRVEYRALEGFVAAVTPFNFTAISGNLPCAPAMAGNVVVWKPSNTQVYSAQVLMEIFQEAGLPPGVINMVLGVEEEFSETAIKHPELAAIHFTGSTRTFQHFWKIIGSGIERYKSYPKIVGETGGKDFVIAHPSADPRILATALTRGAFEYQGQKCSAASRAYIPRSLWDSTAKFLKEDLESIKVGPVEDFSNFVNAVIDDRSFGRIKEYLEYAKNSDECELFFGGKADDSEGYFVEPTVLVTSNPKFRTMCEEIFGPVLTIYVYEDSEWDNTLKLVDSTSPYALTGAVFSTDRYAVQQALDSLTNAAGNFYINDKPTGAVVGQQPFGGSRASGTNDKAGARLNLLRWVSMRTIKENFVPPTDYRYPFLG